MMSVQALYTRQTPKCINGEPLSSGPSLIGYDEVLAIIGQVQSKYHVGSTVLDAQITQNKQAADSLRQAITASLSQQIDSDLAKSLANAAVIEVCESPVCSRCKGTGQLEKKGEGIVQCTKCHGVGNHIPSQRALHALVMGQLPKDMRMGRQKFLKDYYDQYMLVVDRLYRESSNASSFAKEILSKCYF